MLTLFSHGLNSPASQIYASYLTLANDGSWLGNGQVHRMACGVHSISPPELTLAIKYIC